MTPQTSAELDRLSLQEVISRLRALSRIACRQALDELGAHEDLLTEDERAQLDENGFVVLPGILSRNQIDAMHAVLDEVIERAWGEAGGRLPGNRDPKVPIWEREVVVMDLVNRGPAFEVGITHPRVLAALAYVLRGDLRLSYLHMRSPSPGHGNQELHLDTYKMEMEPVHYFANSIWMLDDFTERNGATRFVPGTHKLGKTPYEVLDDYMGPHPDEVKVYGPAGDVIVFDGHVWHGGTHNATSAHRRALFSGWVHRNQFQIDDQRKFLLPETYDRLSDAARFLVDVY